MTLNVITPLTVRGKRLDSTLWHQSGEEIKLGCSRCPELAYCGGLGVHASIFSCISLCCGKPETCRKYACPQQRRYSALVNEVGGFQLHPYKRGVAPLGALPDYVPFLFDAGDLQGPIRVPVIAISLYKLVHHRTGLARFDSREELLQRFRIDLNARIVITSTGEDRHVENFWHVLRLKKTADSLRRLRPLLIATPNFSMHANTVRHDNLLSMSRIAYCFEAFANAGLPVALHVNGRTTFDFSRWTDYLVASPGVHTITYEMGTIGRSATRRAWHAERLLDLAKNVGRPLNLVLRGGLPQFTALARAFRRVIFVDTTAHIKSKKRQSGTIHQGQLKWSKSPTATGEPIDNLFLHNIQVCRRRVRSLGQSALAENASFQSPIAASPSR